MVTNKTLAMLLQGKDEIISSKDIIFNMLTLQIENLKVEIAALKKSNSELTVPTYKPTAPNIDLSNIGSLFEEEVDVTGFVNGRTERQDLEEVQEAQRTFS